MNIKKSAMKIGYVATIGAMLSPANMLGINLAWDPSPDEDNPPYGISITKYYLYVEQVGASSTKIKVAKSFRNSEGYYRYTIPNSAFKTNKIYSFVVTAVHEDEYEETESLPSNRISFANGLINIILPTSEKPNLTITNKTSFVLPIESQIITGITNHEYAYGSMAIEGTAYSTNFLKDVRLTGAKSIDSLFFEPTSGNFHIGFSLYYGTNNIHLSAITYKDEESSTNMSVVNLQDTRDTDRDGISDLAEIHLRGTNPFEKDTDRDGISDRDEMVFGSNPLDFKSGPKMEYSFEKSLGTSNSQVGKIIFHFDGNKTPYWYLGNSITFQENDNLASTNWIDSILMKQEEYSFSVTNYEANLEGIIEEKIESYTTSRIAATSINTNLSVKVVPAEASYWGDPFWLEITDNEAKKSRFFKMRIGQ